MSRLLDLALESTQYSLAVQEYFVEDIADVLQWVAEVAPAVMERSRNEELLMFVVLFLGSAEYLKNPFLRAKLVDVSSPTLSWPCLQSWRTRGACTS